MANLVSKIKEYAKANGVTDIDFLNDVKVESIGNDESIVKWNIDLTQPTDAQLDSYEDSANATENLVTILNNRKEAYPSIGEQLDMQYWDSVNGTTTWKDAIAQVKADNPKPE